MYRLAACLTTLTAVCLALCLVGPSAADRPAEKEPMLAHNVFFTLTDNSPAAKRALVEDGHKYLAPIPGIVFYAAGTLSDVDRPVNDRGFDVALHVVFKNKDALMKYLVHPRHLEYVEKHKPNWKKVRVFDSVVRGAE